MKFEEAFRQYSVLFGRACVPRWPRSCGSPCGATARGKSRLSRGTARGARRTTRESKISTAVFECCECFRFPRSIQNVVLVKLSDILTFGYLWCPRLVMVIQTVLQGDTKGWDKLLIQGRNGCYIGNESRVSPQPLLLLSPSTVYKHCT